MKKTKLALAVAAASLVSTSALATNGTNMVGLGAQSAALGGTGVAAYYGAENVVVNPGIIGKAEGTEFSFGGTLFTPSVKNNGASGGAMGKTYTSDGDRYVVPSVSLVSRVNDNWTFGIGMYGSSGMGVDYRGVADTPFGSDMMDAQSNLQIMRFVPTIAYNQDNFGIGFSPILQYGSLDINYNNGANIGSGAADDLGLGFSLGGYFDISENLTVAASYTSAIEMEYKNQLSVASQPFGPAGLNPFSDKLEQPAELKLGVAYNAGKMTYTAEAKRIKWGDAKGYKDFGWEDQNVFALGVRYDADNFWLGAGFNYGEDPIKEQDGATSGAGAAINLFNNMFFPAITEKHVTLGGGYSLTKNVNIDGAIVRALENTKTVDTSALGMTDANTTKHSQMAYTVTVRYNF